MRRKIIKQKTAFTLTLPIKWIRSHNIDKTGEIEIEEKDNTLILKTDNNPKKEEVKLTLKENDEEYCRIMIENHYLKGFDILNINFQNESTITTIQNIVANLIGIEVVSQKNNSCTISQTAMPTSEEFKTLFNRVISIIKQSLEVTQKAIESNCQDELEEIKQYTNDARRFLLFLTRTIHKNKIIEENDMSFMHILLERLILIQHNQFYLYKKLSEISTNFVNNKIEKKFREAKELFYSFIKQFNNQDLTKFTEISKEWKEIYFDHKLFVNCTEEESIILYHSMNLSKLVFLIAQPNQIRQFKYFK